MVVIRPAYRSAVVNTALDRAPWKGRNWVRGCRGRYGTNPAARAAGCPEDRLAAVGMDDIGRRFFSKEPGRPERASPHRAWADGRMSPGTTVRQPSRRAMVRANSVPVVGPGDQIHLEAGFVAESGQNPEACFPAPSGRSAGWDDMGDAHGRHGELPAPGGSARDATLAASPHLLHPGGDRVFGRVGGGRLRQFQKCWRAALAFF